MEKYNINDFYVGQIYKVYPYNKMFTKKAAIKNLIRTGAIQLNSNEQILNQDVCYYVFLSVFQKVGKSYISLHDGEVYEINNLTLEHSFCKELVPLKSLLPKVSYNIPNELTSVEVYELFNYLFNKKNRYLYNGDLVDTKNLYTGRLKIIFESIPLNGKLIRDYIKPEHFYLLNNSNASSKALGLFSYSDKKIYFNEFQCLFLKQDDGMLNLHNHQIYQQYDDISKSESGYINVEPFILDTKEEHTQLVKALNQFQNKIKISL